LIAVLAQRPKPVTTMLFSTAMKQLANAGDGPGWGVPRNDAQPMPRQSACKSAEQPIQ
jgi:hypothetical protein